MEDAQATEQAADIASGSAPSAADTKAQQGSGGAGSGGGKKKKSKNKK